MKKIGEYDFVKRYIGDNEVKKIYIGNNLIYQSEEISEVLPYDAQIEYLEATGTQLINTNISGGSDCEYSIMFQISSSGNPTYNQLYGSSRPAEAPKLFRYLSKGWYCEYGSTNFEILPNNDYDIHTIEFKNGSIYLDNILKQQVGTYGFGNNYFCLFGYLEEPDLKACAKIYSCKIWKDGQLVRDLIPVRVGQTGYMYDKISEQLFSNQGTGDFVLGPDVNN